MIVLLGNDSGPGQHALLPTIAAQYCGIGLQDDTNFRGASKLAETKMTFYGPSQIKALITRI